MTAGKGARITNVPQHYDPSTWRRIVNDIDQRLRQLSPPNTVYAVTGFVETRALDMGTATATDIGNFLCTLVSDLQAAGQLGK